MLLPRLLVGFYWLFIIKLLSATAQAVQLAGVVQARSTGQPLPYVNIGIKGKRTGTVANERAPRRCGLAAYVTVRQ